MPTKYIDSGGATFPVSTLKKSGCLATLLIYENYLITVISSPVVFPPLA